MKKILVILDGCGGDTKQGKTALEEAHTPNLDYFASKGSTGLTYPTGKKIAPESDSGVLGILGYNPDKYHTGRGPLEVYGMDIKLPKSWVAFRANFATIKDGKIIERRAGRNLSTKEAKKLARFINNQIDLGEPFIFKNSTAHRAVLVIEGKFSSNITNTDPGYVKKGRISVVNPKQESIVKQSKPLDNTFLSKKTAALVNVFTQMTINILEKHKVNIRRIKNKKYPANIVLLRDPGIKLPILSKKKNWAAIVSMALEIGIAKACNMYILKVKLRKHGKKQFYEEIKKDVTHYCKYAIKLLNRNWNRYDNFYIHVKETDIPGHDGLLKEKTEIIQVVDDILFHHLRKKENFKLIVTSDHATPYKRKKHSSDPVPVLIYGKTKDKTKRMTERECKKGSLKTIAGPNLLSMI